MHVSGKKFHLKTFMFNAAIGNAHPLTVIVPPRGIPIVLIPAPKKIRDNWLFHSFLALVCLGYGHFPSQEEEKTMRLRFKEVEVEATKAEAGVRSMEHLTKKAERTADLKKQIYRVDERCGSQSS